MLKIWGRISGGINEVSREVRTQESRVLWRLRSILRKKGH